MAIIRVPSDRATLALAYTAAVNGDTIVLEIVGPHLLPATLNKVLSFESTVDAVVLAATGSSTTFFQGTYFTPKIQPRLSNLSEPHSSS